MGFDPSGADHSAGLPRVGSAVVVIDCGRVLLGMRSKDPNRGKWVLPGGKVRPFETLADAACREMREETGLLVEMGGQLGAFEIVNEPDEHRVIIYTYARPIGGFLRPGSDLDSVRFVERSELPNLDVSDFVRGVLEHVDWEHAPLTTAGSADRLVS